MRARGVRLVAAILGVAMLGGCTSTSAGDPRPAPTGQSKPESSPSSPSNEQDALPSDGAPKVTSPLEADTFQQDPCQALTASQAKGLNVVFPGKPFKGQFGNACEWKGPDYNGGSAAIDFISDDPRGMSSVYRSNSRGEFAFFEALEPFAGHPMAAFGIADTREEGGTVRGRGGSHRRTGVRCVPLPINRQHRSQGSVCDRVAGRQDDVDDNGGVLNGWQLGQERAQPAGDLREVDRRPRVVVVGGCSHHNEEGMDQRRRPGATYQETR